MRKNVRHELTPRKEGWFQCGLTAGTAGTVTTRRSMVNGGRRQYTLQKRPSVDSRRSFISFNYFKLGFRTIKAEKRRRRGCAPSQSTAKPTRRNVFRGFMKRWQVFQRSCSTTGEKRQAFWMAALNLQGKVWKLKFSNTLYYLRNWVCVPILNSTLEFLILDTVI